jgi:hypothetical protein
VGARLVEMDRLLRDIQAELAPDREPAPVLEDPEALIASAPASAPSAPSADSSAPATAASPAPAPATDPAPPGAPDPQLQVLGELSGRLLASTRELLAGYERVLVGPASPPPARGSAQPRTRHRPEASDVTLAAGPFVSLEALRAFELAVAQLPGVRDVAVRGYEGADRAIIEVRLDQSNP